jgi:hypothetical protein
MKYAAVFLFGKIIEEYRRKWGSDEDKSYFLRKEEQKNINYSRM